MQLVKTMKIKLINTSNEEDILLTKTLELYTEMCNYISQEIFKINPLMNFRALNEYLYYFLRSKFNSKAQMTQSAMKTVLARYKAVNTQLMQNPYKIFCDNKAYFFNRDIRWLTTPVCFNTLQADFVYNRDWSFTKDGLSINTIDKRIKVSYVNHFQEYFDGTWKFGTAKLIKRNDNWHFCIPVSKEISDVDRSDINKIVGIDRGLRFLLTTYDGKETRFVHTGTINEKRETFQQVRSQCQSKGTKSAKKVLQRISGRENRYMRDVNHQLSKALIDIYGNGTLFVLEDLTGISFNTTSSPDWNRELRNWNFYDFEQDLSYKAAEAGCLMIKVDAHYTSQRCPKCGKISKAQRNHKLHEYKCSCGFCTNDDRNGSMNIYDLGVEWLSGNNNPSFQ